MGNSQSLEFESQEMVQHSQIRNLTPLVLSENESQYSPRTTSVPWLKSSCHLLPESFKLSENVFSFKFDTLNPCKLIITSKLNNSDLFDISRNSKTFEVPKGIGQDFIGWEIVSAQGAGGNLNKIKELEIKIESKIPVTHSEVTKIAFNKSEENLTPSVEKQIIKYKGKDFVIKDVYGLSETEERSECSVCLFSQKDTLILPCFHICLCASCANMLRVQTNKKCPLCRCGNFYLEAEGLLKLNFEDSTI